MPLVNLGMTESQTKSKSPQNNTFNIFTSNLSFLEIFGNCDQVDSKLTPNGPHKSQFWSNRQNKLNSWDITKTGIMH